MATLQDIQYLVLQGGGIRCAWQAGFITALESTQSFRPAAISAVSASTAVACAMVSRQLEFALDCFKAAISGNKKNIYVSHLFLRRPVFPHAAIYRNALLRVFDQSTLKTLHDGPDIQVLVTRTSAKLPKYLSVTAALSLLACKTFSSRPWYSRMEADFGFYGEFISAQSCATPAELADLVLASSCTPPITPWFHLHGRPVLDGGLVEGVPLGGLPKKRENTLVLLTARQAALKPLPGVVYAQPSEEVRIGSWEYTDPSKIDDLFALGKKDGNSFANSTLQSLQHAPSLVE
jgi:predicted acylesterase/phospholipase RssA